MAVALEQEMKAKAQEARARVIEAEAEVPMAMAEAFRNGNLGIMDYYKTLEMNACLPGCVWNATPRSLSPLERNIGFWTQA